MNDDGLRRLCAAVVEQSCKDYASALYRLKRNPRSYQSQRTVSECERFLIQYADYYCGIDGKTIVRRIQEKLTRGWRSCELKSEQWEENQKKKEYLNGYIKAKRKEQRILDQIQQLRMDKMFPGIQCSDMPGGSNMSDLSDFVVKMEELMQELRQERLEAVNEYTKIYRDIRLVEDEREQEVLTYRYLEGMDWDNVCGMMEKKWSRVHEIHARALKNFKKV